MLKILIAIGIYIAANSTLIPTIALVQQHQVIPSYAKWGKLAMKETQSKYPTAKIIDYLHEGRESKEDSTIEKFKLWLKDGDREFGVFVRIEYTTATEKVVNIEFLETPR